MNKNSLLSSSLISRRNNRYNYLLTFALCLYFKYICAIFSIHVVLKCQSKIIEKKGVPGISLEKIIGKVYFYFICCYHKFKIAVQFSLWVTEIKSVVSISKICLLHVFHYECGVNFEESRARLFNR